jgi:FixJ family two-component response regulator
VFVVDDDAPARDSLRTLIESVGLQYAGYATAEEFLAVYTAEQPGCLVLDLRMPGMDGLDLQEELSRCGYTIPIIFVTGYGEVPVAVHALRAGAVDFLEKPCSHRELLKRICDAVELDAKHRRGERHQSEIARRIRSLSPREREVLDLVLAGKHSKEIAAELGIASKTVDTHRANIMQKLHADSLPALFRMVLFARGDGEITDSLETNT